MNLPRCAFALSLFLLFTVAVHADTLEGLNESFWQWRAMEQPFTNDDIPRVERPANFTVDWTPARVRKDMAELGGFEERWRRLVPLPQASVEEQVDYRLLGSAIYRVRWELMVEQNWKRNPAFYVDQTLGSLFVLLLQPPPFSESRQQALVERMRGIPATLQAARENLTDVRQPFAKLAIDSLQKPGERLRQMEKGLAPLLSDANRQALQSAIPEAIHALDGYRSWIEAQLPGARQETAIGRESYLFFLRNVALLPYTPEELLAMADQEWSRSVAFEGYQEARLTSLPASPLFATAEDQIAAEARDEARIRTFLTEQKILTVPGWISHYRNLLLPDYLTPLEDLGVTDDLTGPSRLNEDGTSYIRRPGPELGFFYLSTARDPRPIIVHEGVPGHYFQLCLGWHHRDPVRRHYYDSGANEGIGFYAEEMMLQAGLFDDNPHTRATIFSFMRLRALRVKVDVKLALGEFTLQQAADYLEQTVPMDKATAKDEAAMFSSTPGQAISYQIGKLQITQLLSDARRAQGSAFSMLRFNDFVWNNGNVPLSLQRWEMLGDTSQLPAIASSPRPR